MRRIRFFLALFLLGWAAPVLAEVQVHFQSKDFASTFPHAFVRLTGTDPATGQPIDTNYGFTPTGVGPGILLGPVQGMIQTVDPVYVSRSDLHFTLNLSDEEYRAVLAIVEKWRTAPQPSYRLNSRNCVHFVAEVATALGLHAPEMKGLMKKPKSYLRKVTADNLALIQQWQLRHAAREPVPAKPAPAAPISASASPSR